jgi:hypothetical protein
MPKSRVRLVSAVVLLLISLTLLAWGFLPGVRTIRRQKIQPTEMQLPTPVGYLFWDASPERLGYSQPASVDANRGAFT